MNHLETDGILVDESFTNHLKRKIANVLSTRASAAVMADQIYRDHFRFLFPSYNENVVKFCQKLPQHLHPELHAILQELRSTLTRCQKQLMDCKYLLYHHAMFKVNLQDLEIDGIQVDDSFSKYLKRRIADVLATRDVTVTDIQQVHTSIQDSVRLECDVSFDDKSVVYIDMPKSEFDAFHHVHPDKVVFDGMHITEEMWQVIRQKLVDRLERMPEELEDVRKCDKIRVVGMNIEDDYGDLVKLQFEIKYEYPDKETMTICSMYFHKGEFEKCRTEDSMLFLADWFKEVEEEKEKEEE